MLTTGRSQSFDALVSFAYNIGSIDGLTAKGTRTRSEIAAKILEYNKAGGKVLSGLIRRRQEERKLFFNSRYSKNRLAAGKWRPALLFKRRLRENMFLMTGTRMENSGIGSTVPA